MKVKVVRTDPTTNDMLEDLLAVRRQETPHHVSKQSLIAELIAEAHKRECRDEG